MTDTPFAGMTPEQIDRWLDIEERKVAVVESRAETSAEKLALDTAREERVADQQERRQTMAEEREDRLRSTPPRFGRR